MGRASPSAPPPTPLRDSLQPPCQRGLRTLPDTVGELLLLSVVIALGFLVAVAFYESMSTRDVLVGRTMRFARRVSRRHWVHGLTYVVTVGVGVPLLVLL